MLSQCYCRDSVLRLGADQVRILLFRECEWRGRKLLFDSMSVQKHRSKSETTACTAVTNNVECKAPCDVRTRDSEVIIEFYKIWFLIVKYEINFLL